MAKKERQKRAARQARSKERAAREAQQAAAAKASEKAGAKPAKAKSKDTSVQKKGQKPAKKPGRIRTYFSDVRAEMHRVTWPSRTELRNYSIAVIVALIVFGVAVFLVDTGFVQLLVAYTSLGV